MTKRAIAIRLELSGIAIMIVSLFRIFVVSFWLWKLRLPLLTTGMAVSTAFIFVVVGFNFFQVGRHIRAIEESRTFIHGTQR